MSRPNIEAKEINVKQILSGNSRQAMRTNGNVYRVKKLAF